MGVPGTETTFRHRTADTDRSKTAGQLLVFEGVSAIAGGISDPVTPPETHTKAGLIREGDRERSFWEVVRSITYRRLLPWDGRGEAHGAPRQAERRLSDGPAPSLPRRIVTGVCRSRTKQPFGRKLSSYDWTRAAEHFEFERQSLALFAAHDHARCGLKLAQELGRNQPGGGEARTGRRHLERAHLGNLFHVAHPD